MNISGKYLRLLKESDLDNADYQTFKRCLLTAAGFTSRGAALQLFQGCPKPPKEVKGAWSWTKCLYNRILEDSITKYHIIVKLVAAKIMTTVDKGCVNYLDCRDPPTKIQFINALQTYYSSNTEVQAHSLHHHQKHHFQRQMPWCQHCKKTGHKTDDCWWKQEPEHTESCNNDGSVMKQPSKENERLTCFACCESGHIKPNCPNQHQMSMADKRPIQKKGGLKVRQLSISDIVIIS